MIIDKLFPTTLYLKEDVLLDIEIENIKKDILEEQSEKDRGNWQSKADLHNRLVYNPLVASIRSANKHYFETLMKWEYEYFIITDMWSNVSKPGEAHRPHRHANNVMSGVYYVNAIEGHPGIHFYDPRPQVDVICPDVKQFTKENSSLWSYPAKQNKMILFPSWLQHYVPVNDTKEKRISISWNIMFKGKIGKSSEYQSSEF